MDYWMSPNTFFIPLEDNKFICYVPLAKRKAVVNAFTKKILEKLKEGRLEMDNALVLKMLEHYKAVGIVNPKEVKAKPALLEKKIQTPSIGFVPSLDCQLRCTYCYSEAGKKDKRELDYGVAKAGIDMVVKNAVKRHRKFVGFVFLGGGEPTFNWKLFTKITRYCIKASKKAGKTPALVMTTNGVLTEKQVEWISKHLTAVRISFDGPKAIQNMNRPFANGKGSFDIVFNAIKKFDALNFPYQVQSIITPKTIKRMPEIVRLFKGLKPRSLWFGGVTCAPESIHTLLDFDLFQKELDKAKRVAKKYGLNIFDYDFFPNLNINPCYLENFILTPAGVSSCSRVTSEKDLFKEIFVYGQYDAKKKKFIVNPKKLEETQKIFDEWDKVEPCKSCFARFSCRSRCPYRQLHPDVPNKRDESFCEFTRKKLLERLLKED